jgi:hypothetical protein
LACPTAGTLLLTGMSKQRRQNNKLSKDANAPIASQTH